MFVSHESFLYLYLSSISNKQKKILVSKSRERKQISIEQTQESLDRWSFTPVVSLDTSQGEFFSERVSILTPWSKTNRSLSTMAFASNILLAYMLKYITSQFTTLSARVNRSFEFDSVLFFNLPVVKTSRGTIKSKIRGGLKKKSLLSKWERFIKE